MKSRKRNPLYFLPNFSKLLFLLVAFLFLLSFPNKKLELQKLYPRNNYYAAPNLPKTALITLAPTSVPFNWSVEKEDEHITRMSLPPDPRMSTNDELFTAMNTYRQANGIGTIEANSTLCGIAQNRANELLANGGLDNHAGFDKYAKGQNEFSRVGEVLFGGTQPQYGVHIVEFGWDRSLTGHREAIRDASWLAGCGGIAGYYAVFIFGSR